MAEHFASGAGVFTPEGFAEALREFGDSINPAVLRGLRASAKVPRAIFLARFTSKGIGKGIFGRVKSGASKLIKIRASGPQGGVWRMSLELTGFAALQETGGQTKPHDIGSKFGKRLKLKVPSVGIVVRQVVHHPGSRIKANPSAPRALEEAAPRIRAAMEKAICEFRAKGVRLAQAAA